MEALNPMGNELLLPQIVIEAYPLLAGDKIERIGRFTPAIPVTPDRTYDIYRDTDNDRLFTHVTTDYPDPVSDSEEFKGMLGTYSFEDIIIPNSEDTSVQIVNSEDFNEEFFVKEGNLYHYVANTRHDAAE